MKLSHEFDESYQRKPLSLNTNLHSTKGLKISYCNTLHGYREQSQSGCHVHQQKDSSSNQYDCRIVVAFCNNTNHMSAIFPKYCRNQSICLKERANYININLFSFNFFA